MDRWTRWAENHFRLLILIPVLGMAVLQFASVAGESANHDERGHIGGGYRYWMTGRFGIDEHPPAQFLWNGAPLLLLHPSVPTSPEETKDEFAFGSAFLYKGNIPAGRLLLYARVPSIVLTVFLILIVAWSARHFFGPAAGVLAAWLCAMDPNIIAHGRYISTDMGSTLTFTLAIVCWVSYLRQPSAKLAIASAAALGLALSTKFSMLVLLGIFPALLALYLFFIRVPWEQVERRIAILFLAAMGALTVIVLIYLPHTWMLWQDQQTAGTSHAIPLPVLPVYKYVDGVLWLINHNGIGHPAYLLGAVSRNGWWYYFPVAYIVKSPTALLLLTVISIVLGLRRLPKLFQTRSESALVLCLLFPPTLYLAIAMNSHINIGIRHILPIFPLFYILGAAAVTRLLPARVAPIVAAALILLQTGETIAAHPYYTSFFNIPAGGYKAGSRYLLDSNLDWGQDLGRLQQYAIAHPDQPLCVEYFGPVDPAHYGIRSQPIPKTSETALRANINCVAAISAMPRAGVWNSPDDYAWLRERTPMGMVGSSIFLYDLRRPAP